jgi:hypothetical protein
MKAVYVFSNPYSRLVKIGVSSNPSKRIIALCKQNGFELKHEYNTGKISNYINIEKAAHKHFEDKNAFCEWFYIEPIEAINYINSLSESFDSDPNYSLISDEIYQTPVAMYVNDIYVKIDMIDEYILKDNNGCFYVKAFYNLNSKIIKFLNEKIAIDFVNNNNSFCTKWTKEDCLYINSRKLFVSGVRR